MVRPRRLGLDGRVSLFWRVVAINTAVLVAAAIALAVSPATVSARIHLSEVVVLAAGVAVALAVDLVLMRRVFGPLERLTALMRRVDPLTPGQRRAADGDGLREEPLTERELEVVKLVAEAYTSEEIAELLTISPRTVERHRENLMAKLGIRDRVQLTRYAIRRGLVEP